MRHGDARIMGDDMFMNGLDGFCVCFHPTHLQFWIESSWKKNTKQNEIYMNIRECIKGGNFIYKEGKYKTELNKW